MYLTIPHAIYSSALTQTVASTSVAYPVIFESPDDEVGIYRPTATFTVVAATNVVTLTGFAPVDGMVVYVSSATTLPSPLAANTAYYIISSSGQTCKLSTSLGGSEIDITDTGTGVHTTRIVSRFYIPEAGHYKIFISALVDTTSAAPSTMDVWFDQNGSNVTKSNTQVAVDSVSVQATLAVELILSCAKADYIRLFYRGSSTNMRLLAVGTATTPTRPACPSIIMSVIKISG